MAKKIVLALALALLTAPLAVAGERPPVPSDKPTGERPAESSDAVRKRSEEASKRGEEAKQRAHEENQGRAANQRPHKAELKQAKRQCQALKKELGRESFAATYPTLWACVRARLDAERANLSEATAECKAKLDKRPKLGKRAKAERLAVCATKTAAEGSALEREAVGNAAKACAEELAADPAGFRAEWGKSRNLANAFGKCVASKAKAGHEEDHDEEKDDVVEDE